jgi:hypothetical protein
MNFWRYQALRMAVAFGLFVVTVPVVFLVMGLLGSQMPRAAFPVALFGVGMVWLLGNMVGSHLITEKISKRWSK